LENILASRRHPAAQLMPRVAQAMAWVQPGLEVRLQHLERHGPSRHAGRAYAPSGGIRSLRWSLARVPRPAMDLSAGPWQRGAAWGTQGGQRPSGKRML